MSNGQVAVKIWSVSRTSLLEKNILPWGKQNGFNDDDRRSRVHCKGRLLKNLDQVFVWPAMTDVLHHIDLCTFRLRVKEIVGLE